VKSRLRLDRPQNLQFVYLTIFLYFAIIIYIFYLIFQDSLACPLPILNIFLFLRGTPQ